MVPPAVLCRQHLLGEHREMHALVGIIASGKNLSGYLSNGLICTGSIQERHDALVAEMTARGYRHLSPLSYRPVTSVGDVSIEASIYELRKRCAACKERIDNEAKCR